MKPNAVLYRLEEILLNSIYESVSRQSTFSSNPENDYVRGYQEGYGECLEAFWNAIQEHNDNNQYSLNRMGN